MGALGVDSALIRQESGRTGRVKIESFFVLFFYYCYSGFCSVLALLRYRGIKDLFGDLEIKPNIKSSQIIKFINLDSKFQKGDNLRSAFGFISLIKNHAHKINPQI